MNPAFKIVGVLCRKIKNGSDLMKEFPQYREEYLDETLHYSTILYDILKESVMP